MARVRNLVTGSVVALACFAGSAQAGTLTNVSVVSSSNTPSAPTTVTITYTLGTALVSGNNLTRVGFPAGSVALTNGGFDGPAAAFCTANMTLSLNGVPTTFASLGGFCGTFSGTGVQVSTGIPIAAGTVVVLTLGPTIATNREEIVPAAMVEFRTSTSAGGTIDSPATMPTVTFGTPVPALPLPVLVGLGLLLMAAGLFMVGRQPALGA
jgi:hypothetical protein